MSYFCEQKTIHTFSCDNCGEYVEIKTPLKYDAIQILKDYNWIYLDKHLDKSSGLLMEHVFCSAACRDEHG